MRRRKARGESCRDEHVKLAVLSPRERARENLEQVDVTIGGSRHGSRKGQRTDDRHDSEPPAAHRART